MALVFSKTGRVKRSEVAKKLLHETTYNRIFIKPSQGVVGIRRVKTPSWSAAGRAVLNVIHADMAAKAPASMCLGHKGKDFYACLKTQANNLLDYANQNGFLYALNILMQKSPGEADNALLHHLLYARAPYSAKMNGHRIARVAALTKQTTEAGVEQVIRDDLVIDAPLFNKEEVSKYPVIQQNIAHYTAMLERFPVAVVNNAGQLAMMMAENNLLPDEVRASFNEVATVIQANRDALINVVKETIRNTVGAEKSLI